MKINVLGTLSFVLLSPSPAFSCPDVQTDHIEQNRLYSELQMASNEMHGRAVGGQLWEIWVTAPDEKSQEFMDLGRERIRVADYERAEEIFDQLIDYCPNYAEGWNQRAFVRYLRQDYGNALEDITAALELEPRHFGALAGRATTLISMGRVKVGHAALRQALAIHPWLSERHLLPTGEDI
ncbi:tetratricopeptide repeat protein [uncultured Litoreibacter sp.]|uniref:tetratricopeptide repeat protein n=1 Tax=uncultured Litoreibacter sp. TaxID=1392394 RepID=UPI002605D35E|nr:tetratricopeptide repeat protein [uncultured Litoreibacter sp.]